jgi:hypothetical protein
VGTLLSCTGHTGKTKGRLQTGPRFHQNLHVPTVEKSGRFPIVGLGQIMKSRSARRNNYFPYEGYELVGQGGVRRPDLRTDFVLEGG